MLSLIANSSIADSVANRPGTAPGPRIEVGVPTLRRASPERNAQIGNTVEIWRRFAAILFIIVQKWKCDLRSHVEVKQACNPELLLTQPFAG